LADKKKKKKRRHGKGKENVSVNKFVRVPPTLDHGRKVREGKRVFYYTYN